MAESKRIETEQPIDRVEQVQAEERSMSGALAQGAAEGAAGVATGALIGAAAHHGRKVVAKLGSLGKQKSEPKKWGGERAALPPSAAPNPRPRPGHTRAAFGALYGRDGNGGKRVCAWLRALAPSFLEVIGPVWGLTPPGNALVGAGRHPAEVRI